jgi:adenine phosphoribosyltransferase
VIYYEAEGLGIIRKGETKMNLNLENYVRDVVDFPKPGIVFTDIAPLLTEPKAFAQSIDAIANQWADVEYDAIAAFDARGFLFGAPLSYATQKPLIMLRKAGKLPGECIRADYDLEYGTSSLELQVGMVKQQSKILLVDDLLATGGTTLAGAKLIEKAGGSVVGCAYIIELDKSLGGRLKLESNGYVVRSLLKY